MRGKRQEVDVVSLTTHDSSLKLWGGRFEDVTDASVECLNNSLAFDARLWRHDIQGSIAHATMLGETGIIPSEDALQIVAGLNETQKWLEHGELVFDAAAEDVHRKG